MIRAKYLRRDTVTSVRVKFGDSPIWKAIMKVKEHYLAGRGVVLNSGNIARVWVDPLNNNPPLRFKFPVLYNICNDQEIMMAKFVNGGGNDFFRRRLHPPLIEQWRELESMVGSWSLSGEPDQIVWTLGKKKCFTTRSVYEHLERHIAGCDY